MRLRSARLHSSSTTALAFLVLFCVLLGAAYVHLRIMRGTTFHVDEWNAIFQYGWSPRQLFEPVNGHNAFLGRFCWFLIMAVFGIAEYLPFRVLGLVFNLFTALSLFVYGYRRSGPVAGLALCTLSLFLGSSFHTILWPAAAIGLFSIAALILVLLLLERDGLPAELGVLAMILLAFGSGGMGIVVYASATVEILLRRQIRRWWLVALPPLAYLAWLLSAVGSRPHDGLTMDNVQSAPGYVVHALHFAVAGLFGREPSSGWAAFTVYLILVALLVVVNRRGIDVVRVASLGAAPVTFWTLTAVFRGGLGEAGAPRYIAFGALPLALILLELTRGVTHHRVVTVGAVAVAGVSMAGNLPMLLTAGANFRHLGEVHRGQLAALEAVRESVDSEYVPSGDWARYVRAGSYLSAVDRFGSPALPLAALSRANRGARTFADEILVAGGQVVVRTAGIGPACRSASGQVHFTVSAGSSITLANTSLTTAELRLRRFAPVSPARPWTSVPVGEAVRLSVGRDEAPAVRWEVESSVPVIAC